MAHAGTCRHRQTRGTRNSHHGEEWPAPSAAQRRRPSYLAAEANDEAFSLLAKYPLGAEDVKVARITAAKSGEKAALDVRVLDLHIRAAAFPKLAPKIAESLQAPKAEYARSIIIRSRATRQKPPAGTSRAPTAQECVQFEREGLHITLPPGWGGYRPGTGVKTSFAVQGDFEITISSKSSKGPSRRRPASPARA